MSGKVLAAARQRDERGWQVDIDPRLDARRRAVGRQRSRPRRILLVSAAVVSLLAASAWPLLHSRWFSARVLRVAGTQHLSTEAVLAAAGLTHHPPMIDVDAGRSVRGVEALPWVATATLTLHWPDAVSIRVTERTAAATLPEGTRWAEVDVTGRVLALVATAPRGLVHLVSVGAPGAPGTTLPRARAALDVAAALPAAFKAMVTAVAPSAGGGVDLALSDGIGVVLGPPSQLHAKFEDIAALLAGAGLASGSVIDVTVPAAPAVSPPPR